MDFRKDSPPSMSTTALNGAETGVADEALIQAQLDRLPVFWTIVACPTKAGTEWEVLDDNDIQQGKHHDLVYLIDQVLSHCL